MPETIANPKPATVDPGSIRLPWVLRAAAVFAIAVPIGMLAHLGNEEREELGQSVEVLGQSLETLGQSNEDLSRRNADLAIERDALAPLPAKIEMLNIELAETGQLLATSNQLLTKERTLLKQERVLLEQERTKTVGLESEVVALNGEVAVLTEREEALRGIIDLLEGEVASAESRLTKLSEQRPSVAPEFSHLTAAAIVASHDPQIRRENERLRNELSKHDEQVVELLGEIGVLNQELEVARREGSKIGMNLEPPANLNGAALASLPGEE